MDIYMDPDNISSRIVIIESPNYPQKYPASQNCQWNINSTKGRLRLVFQKFNIETHRSCRKDFLKISPVKKYGIAKVCGSNVPSSFKLISKKKNLVLQFSSNGQNQKSGFKAIIVAST
jgi:ABC-type histidine transport system ATPase subunit